MSTRLGVLGVPITPSSMQVSVAAGVSVATFSVLTPTVTLGVITPCVANYSINSPVIRGDCKVYPTACAANYSINAPTILTSKIVLPTPCVANYSINTPTVIASAKILPVPCTAVYTCEQPTVNVGFIQPCVANYSINTPTVYGQCNIIASTATAQYSANTSVVIVGLIVYPAPCVADFACNAVSIIGIGNVYPMPCVSNYLADDPTIKADANAIQTECTAIFSGTDPIIQGVCNEYPGVSVAHYNANDSAVSVSNTAYPGVCLANYTSSAVQTSTAIRINAVPASAIYSVNEPAIGALTIVFPAASSIEFYTSPYYNVMAGGIPNYKDISKMPNQWLRKCNGQNYDNERKLYRKLTTEAYNKFGVCMTYYVVTYDTQYDKVYGEDENRRFIRKFDIMAYFPLQTEEKLWTKFAIEGIDNFSVFVSKDHFRTASTYGNPQAPGNKGKNTYPLYEPDRNDVIQSKFNGYLYEIVKVKEEAMMIHLNKRYVWEFILRPYMDEHRSIDTSIAGASLENVRPYVDGDDIMKVNAEAQAAAVSSAYTPRPCEKPPAFPFGGW